MLKVSRKFSTNCSLSLTVLIFAILIVGAIIMPSLATVLINTPDNIGLRDQITDGGRAFVLTMAYLILLFAALADGLLFLLLLRVRRDLIFSSQSIGLIRAVSWCCMLCGLCFTALGYYFQLAFIVAFAAIFLGLFIRVIKNVIEDATALKDENDCTI